LARKLKDEFGVLTVVASGYGHRAVEAREVGIDFLHKPFSPLADRGGPGCQCGDRRQPTIVRVPGQGRVGTKHEATVLTLSWGAPRGFEANVRDDFGRDRLSCCRMAPATGLASGV